MSIGSSIHRPSAPCLSKRVSSLRARMLAWVGLALLAAYLVFIGGGWLGIYTSGLRITTVAVAAVVLGTWAFVAWRRPEWRPRSVLLPPIVACLGSMAISTVFSRVPRVSLEYLGYAVLLAALYLLLVRLMAQPFFRVRLVSSRSRSSSSLSSSTSGSAGGSPSATLQCHLSDRTSSA